MTLTASQYLSSADLTVPSDLSPCSLVWRDRKLMVRLTSSSTNLLAPVSNFNQLVERLRRSPVQAVRLDSKMNKASLLWWAKACHKAGKTCYVSRPSQSQIKTHSLKPRLENQSNPPSLWRVLGNKLIALILLIFSVPIAGTQVLLEMMGGKQFLIQKKWAIGLQGRLFELFELSISNPNLEIQIPLTSGIASHIPKLINVLRGDLNLFGNLPLYLDSSSNISSLEFNWTSKPGLFIRKNSIV